MQVNLAQCLASEDEHWNGEYRYSQQLPVIKLKSLTESGEVVIHQEDIDTLLLMLTRLRDRETRKDGYYD